MRRTAARSGPVSSGRSQAYTGTCTTRARRARRARAAAPGWARRTPARRRSSRPIGTCASSVASSSRQVLGSGTRTVGRQLRLAQRRDRLRAAGHEHDRAPSAARTAASSNMRTPARMSSARVPTPVRHTMHVDLAGEQRPRPGRAPPDSRRAAPRASTARRSAVPPWCSISFAISSARRLSKATSVRPARPVSAPFASGVGTAADSSARPPATRPVLTCACSVVGSSHDTTHGLERHRPTTRRPLPRTASMPTTWRAATAFAAASCRASPCTRIWCSRRSKPGASTSSLAARPACAWSARSTTRARSPCRSSRPRRGPIAARCAMPKARCAPAATSRSPKASPQPPVRRGDPPLSRGDTRPEATRAALERLREAGLGSLESRMASERRDGTHDTRPGRHAGSRAPGSRRVRQPGVHARHRELDPRD